MPSAHLIFTARADEDILEAATYYENLSPAVAQRFNDAIVQAQARITACPEAGSSRYANLLKLPDLRCWLLENFPYAWFLTAHKAKTR